MRKLIIAQEPLLLGDPQSGSRLNHRHCGVDGEAEGSARTRPTGGVHEPFRLTAVAYLRVSTDQQAESGLGLDAQRAGILQSADRLGLTVRDVFVDVISGGKAHQSRPQLLEAVGALHRGEVLLVAKRDRLGRNVFEMAMIERLVQKQRARVVSAAGEGNGDEPADWLMRQMVDTFAQYERILIAKRTKDALAVLRANNERAGNLPFGLQLAADGKHLEPAPVEQRIDATIRALAATVHSSKAITATLNAAGYTTRKGTPWRPEYVSRRLRKVAG